MNKPTALPVNPAAIPDRLKTYANWVLWQWKFVDGKWTKPPYNPKANGTPELAKTNDPSSWATFPVALEKYETDGNSTYDGIGLVLPGTPFIGVDFDGVVHDGKVEPYVLAILEILGGYSEITPSGTGVRTFAECANLPKGKRKFDGKDPRQEHKKYGAEIYIGNEGARFLTLTGEKFSGSRIPVYENVDLAYFLITQIANHKFKALWTGDISAYGGDDSRADLALAAMLAKELNGDTKLIEQYFCNSALGQREKWIGREDYRKLTIAKALDGLRKTTPEELVCSFPKIEGSHRDYIVGPQMGQKDGWFPQGSPSLVGGSSGGGKTTWMMDLLETQRSKNPFLGHETFGLRYIVIMLDRGNDAHQRTMERMGLDANNIPVAFIPMVVGDGALLSLLAEIEKCGSDNLPQIVFVEGADGLLEDANRMQFVAPFMSGIQRIAEHYHIAIVLSVGTPKMRIGEGYIAKRDCLVGSQIWGRMAETVAVIQYPAGDDTDLKRVMSVLPRNAPAETFKLVFDRGKLILDTETVNQPKEPVEVTWFKHQALEAEQNPSKKWWTALDMERELDMAHRTVYRRIADAVAKGHITEKPGRKKGRAAQYCWNDSYTNPLHIVQKQVEQSECGYWQEPQQGFF